jgi:hypothetical protein
LTTNRSGCAELDKILCMRTFLTIPTAIAAATAADALSRGDGAMIAALPASASASADCADMLLVGADDPSSPQRDLFREGSAC